MAGRLIIQNNNILFRRILLVTYCFLGISFISLVFGCGGGSKKANIPIKIENAENLGSIQLELSYDPSQLKAVEVKTGGISKNAMAEANLETPGYIIIGIVDSAGMNGDGNMLEISFDVIDAKAKSSLSLEYAQAHNAVSLVDIPAEKTDGSFDAGKIISPLIRFK